MDPNAFRDRMRQLEENMSDFLQQNEEGDEIDSMNDMLSDDELKMLFREMESNSGPINELKKQVNDKGIDKVLNSPSVQATAAALLANAKKSDLEKKQSVEKEKIQKKLPKDGEKKFVSKLEKKVNKLDKKEDEEKQKIVEKQKQLQRLGLSEKDVAKKVEKKDKPEESVLQQRMASKFRDIMQIFLNNYKDDDVREKVQIKYVFVEKSLRDAHVKWEPNVTMRHKDLQMMNDKLKKIQHLFGQKIEKSLELKYVPEISFYYDIELDDKTSDTSKLKKMGMIDPLATKKETAKLQQDFEEFNNEQKTFINYDRRGGYQGRGSRGGYQGESRSEYSRGGYRGESRGGYRGESRGGYRGESRGGYRGRGRGGYGASSRGGDYGSRDGGSRGGRGGRGGSRGSRGGRGGNRF